MSTNHRVKPSPKIAWIVGIVYAPVFITLLISLGSDYDDIGRTTDDLRSSVVVPMAVLVVALAVLITWLGWWRKLLVDDRPTPRWLLSVPIVLFVTLVLANLADAERLAEIDTSFLVMAAIGTLGVGFCEESVYRGITVVGFRSGLREVHVWLFSSLLFATLHLWNVIAGQDIGPTIAQFVFTFVLGSLFYVSRRATGTIVVPIILHAMWDWTSFTNETEAFADPSTAPEAAGTPLLLVAVFISIIISMGAWTHLFSRTTDLEQAA